MAVLLTISSVLDGTAYADSLSGGGSGIDFGQVANGSYTNVISKPANTGALNFFISHNAVIDPITNVKVYLDTFATTGFTYGGAASAASDYTTFKNYGAASGSSKNNNDGLSSGLWVDLDAAASTTNQFDQANFPTKVKIFGDNTTDGIDLASAFPIPTFAMVYNAPPETAASSPINGTIGKNGDTALGDAAHLKFRYYLPTSATTGGVFQGAIVISYSFTA